MRYQIRAGTTADIEGLYTLSSFLDSVNLPHDRDEIAAILERSEASFSGTLLDPRERQYVFVLHDTEDHKAVGTSMIFGQLGRRGVPYIYLDVLKEEKYSSTLDRHFTHDVLRMGYSFNGPTELGGLVMHPDYRRAPERLGRLISYVRFLWIAMHREDFRDEILAELMPPLEPDGTSLLWEAVGRHFTELSYQEADKLSQRNKEFIRGLFPDGEIYASLLAQEAQAVIGEVGPQTKGVEKMLRRIGFRYANRVDPFDGGPHFTAKTDEISLINASSEVELGLGQGEDAMRCIVAAEWAEAPWLRAIVCETTVDFTDVDFEEKPAVVSEHATVRVSAESHHALTDGAGEPLSVWVLPVP